MVKDPTAWKDDLAFYMTEEAVSEQAEAVEPLLHTGSKAATGVWVAMSGTLGGAFGAITISPGIRDPLTFAAFVVIAALLLRGLYPLTVSLLGKGAGWLAMFAFFWTALLGIGVVLVADVESRWLAYGLSVGLGAFIGMMYGSFPPDVARNDDAWMVAFLLAPIGAVAATYVLRHTGAAETVGGIAAAGALAAAILMAPMGALLVKLWNVSLGLADLGRLYLHNDVFAPKAVAYFDRAIAMSPDNADYYNLRAVGLARMNELERASADWAKASALAPRDPEPHVQRGADCLRRGALDDAVDALNSALSKNPDHARAHGYLGEAFERRQDLARAFEHYDRAVALGRDDAKVHCDRSYAHFRQGRYQAAFDDAEVAVRNMHHLGTAHAALGQALQMLGRFEEAVESFEEALYCGLEPHVHEDVLHRMETLDANADAAEDEGEERA
jgi:Flp pilus assembly protein TadD